MSVILIVDDDAAMRETLREAILDFGHEVHLADSGAAALRILSHTRIGAALIDLRMPGMGGLELLKRIQQLPHPPPTAVLTAHATAGNTIEAMRLGAFDHVTKPMGREELARVLTAMLAAGADRSAPSTKGPDSGLIGMSDAMRAVQKTVGRVADSEVTVLITGETGTGKELVARAIHDHGSRAAEPFIAVNCAAIPTELMETELFGHVKGAFSGAVRDRLGAFREAQRGTLFLDEIGDMDAGLQAKILRSLQERSVTPVGGTPCPVKARIVAATHRELRERVAEGRFREDLFYRLNVVPIHLPPLRERLADIVPLAEYFLSLSVSPKRLTAAAAAELLKYPWPGNVRELKNTMDRLSVTVSANRIEAADLKALEAPVVPVSHALDWPEEDLPTAMLHLEELLIRRALARCRGNRAEAARQLNIHRQALYTKMKRLQIELSDGETPDVLDPDE